LRFAHAVGLKCATVAPEEDLQSRYLSTLSHDKMNSTDVLMELMNFIGDYENTAPESEQMRKLSNYQLYSLYRNFKEHGELVSALREFGLNRAPGVSDRQELLTYVTAMCDALEETHNEVEKLLTERRIAFNFKSGATSDDNQKKFILETLEEAWDAADADVGSHPIGYIAQALIERSIDGACKREGGSGPVSRLTELYDQFSKLGEVKPALLRPLLTSALRRARVRDPKGRAGEIAVILAGKQDKQLLGELFHPLYYAMVRQIDGSRTARHDLLEAINKIEKKGQKGERTKIPEFADAQDQISVWAAIHELTWYANHRGNEYFYEAVMRALAEKEFKGETAENFLYQAQTLDLTGYSAIALEIMRQAYKDPELLDRFISKPDVTTAPVEGTPAVATVEKTVPPEPPRRSVAETDKRIFNDYLIDRFTQIARTANTGRTINTEEEATAIFTQLNEKPEAEVLEVRDFFVRHAWIHHYFINGDTPAEILFGFIAQTYGRLANAILPDGEDYDPEIQIGRQNAKMDRLDEILLEHGFENDGESDPALLLQQYVDALGDGVEQRELLAPFQQFFENEEIVEDRLNVSVIDNPKSPEFPDVGPILDLLAKV
jgi:hypothetical protein